MRSALGPPFAVVAVILIVLDPASRLTVIALSAQVSQLVVLSKATPEATTVPLTAMSIGRLVVVPFA
jgi:hypothetical protein